MQQGIAKHTDEIEGMNAYKQPSRSPPKTQAGRERIQKGGCHNREGRSHMYWKVNYGDGGGGEKETRELENIEVGEVRLSWCTDQGGQGITENE